jgi:hypothetical protein
VADGVRPDSWVAFDKSEGPFGEAFKSVEVFGEPDSGGAILPQMDWRQFHFTTRFKNTLKHSRRVLAVIAFVGMVSVVVVFGYRDSKQIYVSLPDPDQYEMEQHAPRYYKITLQSFDPAAETVHLTAEMKNPMVDFNFNPWNFVDQSVLAKELSETEQLRYPASLVYGPLEIISGSELFTVDSFPEFQRTQPFRSRFLRNLSRIDLRNGENVNLSETPPAKIEADIRVHGSPWLYPFDSYLLVAEITCPMFATKDRKTYLKVGDDSYTFESAISNVKVRAANSQDVRATSVQESSEPRPEFRKKDEVFKANVWREGTILLVLERPLFPKFFAIFFGVISVAWLLVLARTSDSKQLGTNLFGYFLAIWAIRAPLAAGAPPIPTLLDYVVLALYASAIALAVARYIWGFKPKT